VEDLASKVRKRDGCGLQALEARDDRERLVVGSREPQGRRPAAVEPGRGVLGRFRLEEMDRLLVAAREQSRLGLVERCGDGTAERGEIAEGPDAQDGEDGPRAHGFDLSSIR
jgi:hypothetical protein